MLSFVVCAVFVFEIFLLLLAYKLKVIKIQNLKKMFRKYYRRVDTIYSLLSSSLFSDVFPTLRRATLS